MKIILVHDWKIFVQIVCKSVPWIGVAVEKPMVGPGGAKEVGKRRRLW